MRVIPIRVVGTIEVRRLIGEMVQRRVEVSGHVARYRGPEEDALAVYALVRAFESGYRAHEHGSGQSLSGVTGSQCPVLVVDLLWYGIGSVDVAVDDGCPIVVQVLVQLLRNLGVAQWNIAWRNEGRAGLAAP